MLILGFKKMLTLRSVDNYSPWIRVFKVILTILFIKNVFPTLNVFFYFYSKNVRKSAVGKGRV